MDDYNILQKPGTSDGGTVGTNGMSDVNWNDVSAFQSALLAPSPTSGLPAGQRTLEPALARLAALADGHQRNVHKVESGIMKAARAADPVQMFKLNKQYSELMLEHGLAMKVVGKTTQAIEQLGRLQ